jgi:leader peptidase (prepilin peptidase)/N-methyltransferase
MAMIGVFLGWQASLMIFFLAPFVAVAICLIQWTLTRRRDIAFGPYLCIAAVIMVLYWTLVWEVHAKRFFELGWLIPQILSLCMILLAGMLGLWRLIEGVMFGSRGGDESELSNSPESTDRQE